MTKRRRNVLLVIFIPVLFAGFVVIYGYREFSRKTVSAESMKADWTLGADTLINQFAADEKRYTEIYTGKVLEVSGIIKLVEGLPTGSVTVVLQGANSHGSIRMLMDSTMNNAVVSFAQGQPITIRGICIGYAPDDMGLGADVLFNRSVIINN